MPGGCFRWVICTTLIHRLEEADSLCDDEIYASHMHSNVDVDGAVDIHGHSNPSIFERRVDGYEFASLAAQAGMDAIVIKQQHFPSVNCVPYIDRLLERDSLDIQVIGSLVMNYWCGGTNPFAVQLAIDYGAKIVWFPTIDARSHREKTGWIGGQDSLSGDGTKGEEYETISGLTVLDSDDKLTDEAKLCVRKIVDSDIAFSTGHLSFEEAEKLIAYAAEFGHDKMFVDHPTAPMTEFSDEQQQKLADHGAYMNYIFGSLSPRYHWLSGSELLEQIRSVGVDNCVVSSDMGQPGNPHSPDALRMTGEILVDEGLSKDEFRTLVKTNPKKLVPLN
jgi:hypothetical protein